MVGVNLCNISFLVEKLHRHAQKHILYAKYPVYVCVIFALLNKFLLTRAKYFHNFVKFYCIFCPSLIA